MKGKRYTFDSFECAIHALIPTYAHAATRPAGIALKEKARSSGVAIVQRMQASAASMMASDL